MRGNRPERIALPHDPPPWVAAGERFFLTICCANRLTNQLCLPEKSETLLEAARTYHRLGRWHLSVFLLMPDHIHLIASFPHEASMRQTVRAWKAYHTRHLGIEWQSGFFDHRLRSDASADDKYRYILANPVRAGLVENPVDWPRRWEPAR